ncbi:hypothetical protein GQ56_0121070 [Burkholderia paludis]|nr:hypothetical protein GQ56_0121070 [Burkholderia paludis]
MRTGCRARADNRRKPGAAQFDAIDDFNRETRSIEIDCSLPPARTIRTRRPTVGWHGWPSATPHDRRIDASATRWP